MRKFITVLVAAALGLSACTQPAAIQGKTYPAYGLLNEDTNKSDKVCYEASAGSIVAGIILVETIIAPVYFFGYDLYQPVHAKAANGGCGIDA